MLSYSYKSCDTKYSYNHLTLQIEPLWLDILMGCYINSQIHSHDHLIQPILMIIWYMLAKTKPWPNPSFTPKHCAKTRGELDRFWTSKSIRKFLRRKHKQFQPHFKLYSEEPSYQILASDGAQSSQWVIFGRQELVHGNLKEETRDKQVHVIFGQLDQSNALINNRDIVLFLIHCVEI